MRRELAYDKNADCKLCMEQESVGKGYVFCVVGEPYSYKSWVYDEEPLFWLFKRDSMEVAIIKGMEYFEEMRTTIIENENRIKLLKDLFTKKLP